jgi:hypothetical protein
MSNTDESYVDIAQTIDPVRTIVLTFVEYPDGLVLIQNDTEFCNGATIKRTTGDAQELWDFLVERGFIRP